MDRLARMFERCPKCHHHPLPLEQALPAACPACGVILAKLVPPGPVAAGVPAATRDRRPFWAAAESVAGDAAADAPGLRGWLLHVPARVDVTRFWLRLALLACFAIWGLRLIALDYRSGEMASSFIHGPLLVFHEAGHVLFRLFGEWVAVLGGTLGQLLMPAVLVAAFVLKNRDPFGAAIGLWLLGVSLLDMAPYMYDALQPQLVLLSGATGEAGGHDWIYLFSSLGLLPKAQFIGALIHKLGALVLLLALAWAAWVLKLQRGRLAGDVTHEA